MKTAEEQDDKKPNPGSIEALGKGCECAVIDNEYGQGAYFDHETKKPVFWINAECPLHGLNFPKK